jgi:hypothetical protein
MASDNGNYGLNFVFNLSNITSPTLINIVLQCGYGTYPGLYSLTSAVDDLIVSLYFNYSQNTLTYVSY